MHAAAAELISNKLKGVYACNIEPLRANVLLSADENGYHTAARFMS